MPVNRAKERSCVVDSGEVDGMSVMVGGVRSLELLFARTRDGLLVWPGWICDTSGLRGGSIVVAAKRFTGTKAFNGAEEKGTPLAAIPMTPVEQVRDALPLDQLIISFAR
ncbi:MAG: hypothetical protein ABI286_00785 [Edaphobacter sp.]